MAHYIAMSGSFGCLPDYTNGYAEERDDCVECLLFLFDDSLTETEYGEMRHALESEGIYSFPDRQRAGADYAEIAECDCADPSCHEES